jgi:hypothetical protein
MESTNPPSPKPVIQGTAEVQAKANPHRRHPNNKKNFAMLNEAW